MWNSVEINTWIMMDHNWIDNNRHGEQRLNTDTNDDESLHVLPSHDLTEFGGRKGGSRFIKKFITLRSWITAEIMTHKRPDTIDIFRICPTLTVSDEVRSTSVTSTCVAVRLPKIIGDIFFSWPIQTWKVCYISQPYFLRVSFPSCASYVFF